MTPKWHWPRPPPWSTPAAAAPSSCPTPRPSTASPLPGAGPASAPTTRPSLTPSASCAPGWRGCGRPVPTTPPVSSTPCCGRLTPSPSWSSTAAGTMRRGRLQQRPRRPVQEPVPAVLQHLVREPDQRRRLPDAPRRPGRDRDQLAQDDQIELSDALGIGQQVDGDDLPAADGEAEHHARLAALGPDQPGGAVHERWLRGPGPAGEGAGHLGRAVNVARRPGPDGRGVGPEHHL